MKKLLFSLFIIAALMSFTYSDASTDVMFSSINKPAQKILTKMGTAEWSQYDADMARDDFAAGVVLAGGSIISKSTWTEEGPGEVWVWVWKVVYNTTPPPVLN